MILVSGCLAGRICRYDGVQAGSPELMQRLAGRPWLAVCPEQLGGLCTPRPRAKIVGGCGRDVLEGRARVMAEDGTDLTRAFIRGAELALDLAERVGMEIFYFKDRSPSCGVTTTAGSSGKVPGPGVTAALFEQAGLNIREIRAFSHPGSK